MVNDKSVSPFTLTQFIFPQPPPLHIPRHRTSVFGTKLVVADDLLQRPLADQLGCRDVVAFDELGG